MNLQYTFPLTFNVLLNTLNYFTLQLNLILLLFNVLNKTPETLKKQIVNLKLFKGNNNLRFLKFSIVSLSSNWIFIIFHKLFFSLGSDCSKECTLKLAFKPYLNLMNQVSKIFILSLVMQIKILAPVFALQQQISTDANVGPGSQGLRTLGPPLGPPST